MKQIAQYQDGRLELQEVPCPAVPPGGVLVRTTHSVISVGTEKMKVEQARMNLLQKARARPDQVRKVMDTARTLGWKSALEKVRNRLETPTPLGYSAAGIVEAVDPANTRFRVGDRVACGGAECAFHAELLAMPDLLVAAVPDGVAGWEAAYTTLCSIALQAVRQTAPGLGERVLVMGQGLIGLLVTRLLEVSGARVMAVDVQESRRGLAEAMGAERVVIQGSDLLMDHVREWTRGYGVDAVVICTASSSNAPIEQAAEAARDRARLVDVGNTRIELPWKIFYEKELDVRFSRSYGPGRYDPVYEWGGVDYPIGYVRWTEQRNFEACLQLMAEGRLTLDKITTRRAPFAQAIDVYGSMLAAGSSDVGVVLEYAKPAGAREVPPARAAGEGAGRKEGKENQATVGARLSAERAVNRVDVIGAGNFARTMLLPHLQGKVRLGTVVNQTSLSANHVQGKFGFAHAATDHRVLWKDGEGESGAVLIATRHHLHAPLVCAALRANRHVFVEKPLCLTRDEMRGIDEAMADGRGSVQVGFNRRFAPASVELRKAVRAAPGPKTVSYHVLAGKLDPQHWYANLEESGGRILGEACHFLDYFCYLFGSKPARVTAQKAWPTEGRLAFADSIAAQVEFSDGSCGQLIYTAEGDPGFPKETVRVFGAGLTAELVNFQRLSIHRRRRVEKQRHSSKGHGEQMLAWASFLRGETTHPLPYAESRQSMDLTFAVLESIQRGCTVELSAKGHATD